jgi:hypothetical protein
MASTKTIAFSANQSSVFRLPRVTFILHSFTVECQMPKYMIQSRDKVRNPIPQSWRLHLSACQSSHTISIRLSISGLRTHITNQTNDIPSIISPGSHRLYYLVRRVKNLILTLNSLAQAYSPATLRCLL